MYVVVQRRQSKYICGGGDRGAKGVGNFFLILYLKMANCGAFLVQFIAVQLVALHAKSSAYERIEQKAAKQGYWKLYIVAFFTCHIRRQSHCLHLLCSHSVYLFAPSKFYPVYNLYTG